MGEKLIEWYEDQLDKNIDDINFDDLLDNPQQELFDFGVDRAKIYDKSRAETQLQNPILNDSSNVSSDIFNLINIKSRYDDSFEVEGDLKLYSKALRVNFKRDVAKNTGTQVARLQILEGSSSEFDDGLDFLREHNSQSLGQLVTSLKRRKEGREENTRKLFKIFNIEVIEEL